MSSGVDAVSRVVKLYAATGKALLRGLPREATCPSKPRNAGRSWKPFTRANEKFHLSPISQHFNGEFVNAEDREKSIRFLP